MDNWINQTEQNHSQIMPQDNCLCGLSTMLNTEKIRSLLSSSLNKAFGEIRQCDISYIRYKPETNCVIAYALQCSKEISKRSSPTLLYAKLYTDSDYENAVRKAEHHRWVDLPGIKPFIALPQLRSIIYFFPNDCVIDGLRLISNPKKIQRILYEHYGKYPEREWRISDRHIKLRTVRYKPERRAVLYCKARAKNRLTNERRRLRIYLRIYADERGAQVFSLQRRLYELLPAHSKLNIPKPITYLPERRLFFMEALKGDTLLNSLTNRNAKRAVVRAAKALANLHRLEIPGLDKKPIDRWLDEASSSAELLKCIAPKTAAIVEEILISFRDYSHVQGSVMPGFVHGDFYYGQILLQEDCEAIIDFDRSHAGDVAADIGNFCAHLRLLRLRGQVPDDDRLEQEFKKAYERASGQTIADDRFNFWTAFGLFQLSVGPFRRLESHWLDKTRSIIEECQKILTRH